MTARRASLSREKATLREVVRADLAGVGEDELRRASDSVRAAVLGLEAVARARAVLSCLSFGQEIDTWKIVDELGSRGMRIAVPRADRGDPHLHVHPWPCRLRRLRWGLRQPVATEPELDEAAVRDLDAALIPGLAFHPSTGRRLGYGGGYFDRFLARTGIPGIGLALERQVRNDVPGDAHDLPMRWIVTEAGVRGPFGVAPPAGAGKIS